MSVIDTLVTDRVGGFYNVADLIRVSEAVQYVAGRLNAEGYTVEVNPKTDWLTGTEARDILYNALMSSYLADVQAIKDVFNGTVPLPAAMDNIDYVDANNIEKLLKEIDSKITAMLAGFKYCGMVICGMEGL